jgi:O-antigen ligase
MAVLLAASTALLVGVLLAARTSTGLAAVVALLYAPLIFFNLPLALTLWVPLTFMTSLHFAWSGPAVISVMLLAAWIGTLAATRTQRVAVLTQQRSVVAAIVLFLLWGALSVLWSTDNTRALEALLDWLVAAGVFLVVATTITNTRQVRFILLAFVIGGVASVIIGFATTGLHPSPSALTGASQAEGRLTGGSGDPNYLAAGLVASVVIATALLATTRRMITRTGLLFAIAILVAGVVASESRGALLASLGAALGALVLFKRRRLMVGGILATIAVLAGLWLAVDPTALNRLTNFNGGGTGRSDLWKVAWRVGTHHPIVGVGLENFVTQESQYVREPGTLTFVALIADKPHVVHNLYLQAFTETGAIGFVLLIGMAVGFLGSGIRAARRFDIRGQTDLATLSRAVVVAELSIFIALFFLSDGTDERFWVLFGAGAGLLGLAARGSSVASRS